MDNVQSLVTGHLTNIESLLASEPRGYQNFLVVMIVCMVYGVLANSLYYFYFKDNEARDGSLARSLVLLCPILGAIFWMIQSSLILSLGLLGSLSFVRYRTPIKRSEDLIFVILVFVLAMSSSILRYDIGLITLFLCFMYSAFRNFGLTPVSRQFAVVTINSGHEIDADDIAQCFAKGRIKHSFISSRSYDGITSLVFNCHMTSHEHLKLIKILKEFDADTKINVFFPSERLGI